MSVFYIEISTTIDHPRICKISHSVCDSVFGPVPIRRMLSRSFWPFRHLITSRHWGFFYLLPRTHDWNDHDTNTFKIRPHSRQRLNHSSITRQDQTTATCCYDRLVKEDCGRNSKSLSGRLQRLFQRLTRTVSSKQLPSLSALDTASAWRLYIKLFVRRILIGVHKLPACETICNTKGR